jgi:fucose permease
MCACSAFSTQAMGFVLIPFSRSMLALTTTFGIVALSWNIINTAGNTYVLWIGSSFETTEAQTVLINMVNALFGAGSLAAPLVAELCAARQPLGSPLSAFWVSAAATAVTAVLFLLLPSPQPPSSTTPAIDNNSSSSSNTAAEAVATSSSSSSSRQLQQPLLAHFESAEEEDHGCRHAARHVCANSSSLPPDAVRISSSSSNISERRDAVAAADSAAWSHWWQGGHLTGLLLIISVFNFLNVGTEVAYGAWVFTYTVKQAQLSDHIGHFLNAAYWGSFTVGRVFASFAAAALQPTTILLCSLPLAVLGAAAALLVPPSVAGSVWLLLTVSVLIGLGASAGFANSLALLDKYHPCTGSVTGWLGGVAGAGCMTIPFLISFLAKHTVVGYQGLMVCCLLSFLGQVVCVPAAVAVGEVWWRNQHGFVVTSNGSISRSKCVVEPAADGQQQQQHREPSGDVGSLEC